MRAQPVERDAGVGEREQRQDEELDVRLQPFLELLPLQGAGITLESLRDADDAAIVAALQALAARLGAAGGELADAIGARYFTLAHGLERSV